MRGDNFLGSLSPGVTNGFLVGRLSFPSAFLSGAPFPVALRADEDAASPFVFFSSGNSCPHLHPLPSCLHFCQGQVTDVKPSGDKKEKRREKSLHSMRVMCSVSKVIKSLHFRCSNGISRTRLMKASCSSVMVGRMLVEKGKITTLEHLTSKLQKAKAKN